MGSDLNGRALNAEKKKCEPDQCGEQLLRSPGKIRMGSAMCFRS